MRETIVRFLDLFFFYKEGGLLNISQFAAGRTLAIDCAMNAEFASVDCTTKIIIDLRDIGIVETRLSLSYTSVVQRQETLINFLRSVHSGSIPYAKFGKREFGVQSFTTL